MLSENSFATWDQTCRKACSLLPHRICSRSTDRWRFAGRRWSTWVKHHLTGEEIHHWLMFCIHEVRRRSRRSTYRTSQTFILFFSFFLKTHLHSGEPWLARVVTSFSSVLRWDLMHIWQIPGPQSPPLVPESRASVWYICPSLPVENSTHCRFCLQFY